MNATQFFLMAKQKKFPRSVSPTFGAELLIDGGVEAWTTATNLTNWTETVTAASTVNREATIKHGGSFSARLDIDGSLSNANIVQQISNSIGNWLQINGWGYSSASGKKMRYQVGAVFVDLDPGPAWANNIASFRAANINEVITFGRGAGSASSSLYHDDLSVKIMTLASLFRTKNLTSDVTASALITMSAGTQAGLVLNLDSKVSPANFAICYHNGLNIKLEKCVAGTYTTLIDTPVTLVQGAKLSVAKSGTTYTVTYNSSAVGASQTIADAGIISNTLHGIFSTYSGNVISNFLP